MNECYKCYSNNLIFLKIVHVITDNGSHFIKAFKSYVQPSVIDSDSDMEDDSHVHQLTLNDTFSAVGDEDT